MRPLLLISGLIPVLLLLAAGLAIKFKKAYWLISGYNTMSAEKKKNVDIEGLGTLAANLCFVIAGIVLAMFLLLYANQTVLALIVAALLIPVVIFSLIKAQSFDGNTRDSEGKMNKSTKLTIGVISGFLILIIVFVGILGYYSSKPAGIEILEDSIRISGMYGREIPLASLENVEIRNTLPEIQYKTNGSAIGTKYKGYFKLKDVGTAILYLDTDTIPFIYLKTDSQTIFLNTENSAKTKELFNQILDLWLEPGH